jgi:hypothetical protein
MCVIPVDGLLLEALFVLRVLVARRIAQDAFPFAAARPGVSRPRDAADDMPATTDFGASLCKPSGILGRCKKLPYSEHLCRRLSVAAERRPTRFRRDMAPLRYDLIRIDQPRDGAVAAAPRLAPSDDRRRADAGATW